ncbi:UpxY family transcription antiterminator [Occallatibacter riparius]|uniref:UpxY family transcription antiterminator n=1 Tax=Occallatibacter riparius TaxID=1002689 RepID=A0A9J7BY83_9BACT|nr:UpxY family transcription antiterminator [Occallatibacter riparius]UWZ87066.1 UpxY family transcription antiterminator [Occallatibacter riparius]
MNLSRPELDTYEASGWWALYTKHQHEKTVADMLLSKGLEVFLPLYDTLRQWKDRKKVISLPLFPCYVFVKPAMNRRLQVVSTPGVHMILTRGGQDALITNPEIDAIRRCVEGPLQVEPHPFLNCGERVRVTRGSLKGLEGILLRKKNTYRLIVSVEMLSQSVAVELPASDVEPASASQFSTPLHANPIMAASRAMY